MNRSTRIIAGSAIALLTSSASSFAISTADASDPSLSTVHTRALSGFVQIAQSEEAAPAEILPEKKQEPEAAPAEPEPQAAPEPEPAPKRKAKPEAAAPEPQAEEPAAQPEAEPQAAPEAEPKAAEPEPEAAPQPEQKPRSKKSRREAAPEQPAAEQAEPQPEAAPAESEPEAAPQPEQKPRSKKSRREAAPEQPAAEQPQPEAAPAPAEAAPPTDAPNEQPAVKEPTAEQPAEKPGKKRKAAPATEKPAAEQPAEPAPLPAPDGDASTPPDSKLAPAATDTPTEVAPGEPAPAEVPAEQPAPAAEQPANTQAPNDGSEAPLFDSQKQQPSAPAPKEGAANGEPAAQPPVAEAPPGPPPASDKAAQQEQKPVTVAPVNEEKGVRVERAPDAPDRRERPKGSEVLREVGDRTIIQFNNQVIVESNDRPRMSRGARDVYYEDLSRGRTRETITRPDGTRVVTVRNEYGDVIRRSRITPEDREYVLSYVDEEDYDSRDDWRDPGLDLPPMRLDIPRDEYIFDVQADETPERYYDFLDQPPVEQVERLYSIDEVKRSARVRDKTRRVDLDTLTFDFGKATIPEAEVVRLQSVAAAMEKMLAKNPAETFLIEGHTDAVGSDLANLALSDRRAEAVADALTNVFDIPPENLATQGYGEQYLKIRTQEPQRENRRVAIRRITPLVAPVASAQ